MDNNTDWPKEVVRFLSSDGEMFSSKTNAQVHEHFARFRKIGEGCEAQGEVDYEKFYEELCKRKYFGDIP